MRLRRLRSGIGAIEVAGLLLVAAGGRRLSLPVWVEALGSVEGEPGLAPRVLAGRVDRWGRRIPGAGGCWPQALAGVALLRRHGHHPELVIGTAVRPFRAHAWVCVDGVAVIGAGEASDFIPVWTRRFP